MIRASNWQASLDAYLNVNATRAFKYGSFDCCLFVCDAIERMTGIDPAVDFRGCYSNRCQAMRLIKREYGAATVRVVTMGIAAKLGLEQCSIETARRGDLVLIKRPHDYSLGLVDLSGERIAVLTAKGIQRIPLTSADLAWHI